MGKQSVQLIVTFLTILMMVVTPMVAAASGTYSSQASQQVVSWDSGWEETEPDGKEAVISDSVSLQHADSGAELLVAFVTADQDATAVRDAAFSSSGRSDVTVSQLEAGEYGDVAYSVELLRSEGDGAEGVFTLMISNSATGTAVVYVLVTDSEAFSEGVSAVQAGVTIDGSTAMNGVDPAGMQNFLNLAQSTSTQTTESVQVPATDVVPTQEPADTTTSAGNTYTSPVWGYTVEFSSPFVDVSEDADLDLMIASYSPLVVVAFIGIENPGASPSMIFDALTPTFLDTLGSNGSYIDGGYSSDRAIWAGVTSDGNQMVQQVVVVSPSTVVIVTIIGEPGVNMGTVADVKLNGISIFGN
jgi:hypothetical protein